DRGLERRAAADLGRRRPGRGSAAPRRGRARGGRVGPQARHRHPGLRPRRHGRPAGAPSHRGRRAGRQRQDGLGRAVPGGGRAPRAAGRLRHPRGARRGPARQPAHARLRPRGVGGGRRLALRRRLAARPRRRATGPRPVQHGDAGRADRPRGRRHRRRAARARQPQRRPRDAGGRRGGAAAAALAHRVPAQDGADRRPDGGDARRPRWHAVALRRRGVRRRQRRAAAQRPRGQLPAAHPRGAQDARRHAPQGRRRLHRRARAGPGRPAHHGTPPGPARRQRTGLVRQPRARPAHPRWLPARVEHAAVGADGHRQDPAGDAVRRRGRRLRRAGAHRRLRGDARAGPRQRPSARPRLRGLRGAGAAPHRVAVPGGRVARRPPRRDPRPRRAAPADPADHRQPVRPRAAGLRLRLPRVRHLHHVVHQDRRARVRDDRRVRAARRRDVGHREPHLGAHRHDRAAPSRRARELPQARDPRAQDAGQQPRPPDPRAVRPRRRPRRRRAVRRPRRRPHGPAGRPRL
ncbi:MAG: Circadian clock protein KaiC, partial [uncultured Frankineae bacterium]